MKTRLSADGGAFIARPFRAGQARTCAPGQVRRANPGGFTLIELVVAVAMIAIMALMSFPLFSGFLQAQQLRGASEQVRTLLNQARQFAIAQNTSYRVDVDTAGKRLRFCSGTAACIDTSAWKGPGTDSSGYIKLDDAIEIPSATSSTFNYLGTAAPAGAVMVKRETTCLNVSVSASGRIQIASATCP